MSASPSMEMDLQALEAEQSLLGACIINAEAIDVIDGIIDPDDFATDVHAHLYAAMVDFRHEGRKIGMKLLITAMGGEAQEKVDGTDMTVAAYIARIVAEAPSVLNARDYALTVRDCASYRRLGQTAELITARCKAGHSGGNPSSIASDAIGELDEVASASQPHGTRRMSAQQAGDSAFETMMDRKTNGTRSGLSWGLRDLDRATLGLHPGHLVVLAARPAMGKSTMAITAALSAARAEKGVIIFSLEMTAEEIGVRMLSDLAYSSIDDHIPYQRMISGDVTESEIERIQDAKERMSSLPIMIDQQGGLSVAQIAARTRIAGSKMARKGQDLGLVIVDHMQLVAASQRYAGSRHNELGEISSSLKSLAKEMSVPVLALSQLSRAVEQRDNKRPKLSDLRESGRIEEDADAVLFLYRDAYYLSLETYADKDKEAERIDQIQAKKNLLEINIAKQRQGPTRKIEAFIAIASNAIRNLDKVY